MFIQQYKVDRRQTAREEQQNADWAAPELSDEEIIQEISTIYNEILQISKNRSAYSDNEISTIDTRIKKLESTGKCAKLVETARVNYADLISKPRVLESLTRQCDAMRDNMRCQNMVRRSDKNGPHFDNPKPFFCPFCISKFIEQNKQNKQPTIVSKSQNNTNNTNNMNNANTVNNSNNVNSIIENQQKCIDNLSLQIERMSKELEKYKGDAHKHKSRTSFNTFHERLEITPKEQELETIKKALTDLHIINNGNNLSETDPRKYMTDILNAYITSISKNNKK